MALFGPTHLTLLAAISILAIVLVQVCQKVPTDRHLVRLILGWGLVINELIWWGFRYSHEGVHIANLPLQLCDVTLWASAIACLTVIPTIVELAYFAGLAGAGMALLTPDLWSRWPTYPAIYFFVAHGGIVIACAVLVFGRICPLNGGAMWRAYGLLLAYAFLAGMFNKVYGTNYMYLCRKPKNASLLDALGPWPWYLIPAAATALALFWLLSLPATRSGNTKARSQAAT
ncbi:conserved membrane hypothetical protein [Candidatus Sulfopaludibacter sp. SbA3]|nr:conserved membrane hypothetical protein [Candidatus Sulfopaludibacter sp. SbA3]